MAIHTMPISELRAHLADAVALVEGGDRVLLTKHSRIVAAIVPPDSRELSALETRAASLLARMTSPGQGRLPTVVDEPTLDPAAWVREITEARR